MRFRTLSAFAFMGLLAGVQPAQAKLTTNASGQWQYIVLGPQFGQYAGYHALVVNFAPTTVAGPWARNIAIFDSQSLGGATIKDVLVNGQSTGWHTSYAGGCLASALGGPSMCLPSSQVAVVTGSNLASSFIVVLDRPIGGKGAPTGWNVQWDGNNTPTPGTNGGFTTTAVVGPPPVVTPEPVTMTLLATGLTGVGGMGLRRRRKNAA
ncbi:MAG: PEP-CTERM sorting domain-containing protein [Gemmatimonadota bacterium]